MITTLKEAEAALAEGLAEHEADTGQAGDEVWYDFAVATAQMIALDDPSPAGLALAREFCRTQTGSIPLDLEPYLGKKDWLA